ncbi:hypothetical protein [Terrabacter sp. 2RAF25]|uniref:hypothetical protein n=1 Tax=Terrabacter sp. 2RAF25 TaxID=3232998 RepID=UPI003F979B32
MTSGSADTQHLIEQVRSVAAGGPYVVAERPYGFDLTIDPADAHAADLIRRHGLERVLTHQVRLDEGAHALSITDISHLVRWDPATGDPGDPGDLGATGGNGGGLSLHAERGGRPAPRARAQSTSFDEALGVESADTGQLGGQPVASGEGRELVREAAEALGWREQRGRDRRIALAVAGIAVAGLLVAGLITLVIKLAG